MEDPMKLRVIGIDLRKTVFHLVGLDSSGKAVIRKKCSRRQLLAFTATNKIFGRRGWDSIFPTGKAT
jgi:hypothetical protein